MKLIQVTDRIWYFPLDDTKDRPILGYIRGDRFSVAVDAGHSAEHVQEFYAAIKAAGLPLPALTVITHWHWDHTFGMHAVNGLTLANRRTNEHLTALLAEHGDDLLGFQVALVGYQVLDIAHLHLGDDSIIESLARRHGAIHGHLCPCDGHVILELRQRCGDGQRVHLLGLSELSLEKFYNSND